MPGTAPLGAVSGRRRGAAVTGNLGRVDLTQQRGAAGQRISPVISGRAKRSRRPLLCFIRVHQCAAQSVVPGANQAGSTYTR